MRFVHEKKNALLRMHVTVNMKTLSGWKSLLSFARFKPAKSHIRLMRGVQSQLVTWSSSVLSTTVRVTAEYVLLNSLGWGGLLRGDEGYPSLVHIEHRGHRPRSPPLQLLHISFHTALIPPHLRVSPHSSILSPSSSLQCPHPARATDPWNINGRDN